MRPLGPVGDDRDDNSVEGSLEEIASLRTLGHIPPNVAAWAEQALRRPGRRPTLADLHTLKSELGEDVKRQYALRQRLAAYLLSAYQNESAWIGDTIPTKEDFEAALAKVEKDAGARAYRLKVALDPSIKRKREAFNWALQTLTKQNPTRRGPRPKVPNVRQLVDSWEWFFGIARSQFAAAMRGTPKLKRRATRRSVAAMCAEWAVGERRTDPNVQGKEVAAQGRFKDLLLGRAAEPRNLARHFVAFLIGQTDRSIRRQDQPLVSRENS